MSTLTYSVTLTTKACPVCAVAYALPQILLDRAEEDDSRQWFCPNGHSLHFPKGGREIDKLRAGLLTAESERDFARRERDAAERLAERERREAKRILKRANAGVCQDCHRSFADVAKHRATKHGDEAARKMTAGSKAKKRATAPDALFPTGPVR